MAQTNYWRLVPCKFALPLSFLGLKFKLNRASPWVYDDWLEDLSLQLCPTSVVLSCRPRLPFHCSWLGGSYVSKDGWGGVCRWWGQSVTSGHLATNEDLMKTYNGCLCLPITFRVHPSPRACSNKQERESFSIAAVSPYVQTRPGVFGVCISDLQQ